MAENIGLGEAIAEGTNLSGEFGNPVTRGIQMGAQNQLAQMLSGMGSDLITTGIYGMMGNNAMEQPVSPRLKRYAKFTAPTDYMESDLTGLN